MKKVKILWAVPCCYYGSEALSDLYDFFGQRGEVEVVIIGAYDGAEASKKIHDENFDLIILDEKLPYIKIVEFFLLGISYKNFFQLKGDIEGPFVDLKKILKNFF